GGLVDLLPFALVFGGRGLVALAVFERCLARKAPVVLDAIGIEVPLRDSGSNRAARLAVMRAVAEAAAARKLRQIVERRVETVAFEPRLQLTHARRIDQQGAARQLEQLACSRRMASLTVGRTDCRDAQQLAPEETVD